MALLRFIAYHLMPRRDSNPIFHNHDVMGSNLAGDCFIRLKMVGLGKWVHIALRNKDKYAMNKFWAFVTSVIGHQVSFDEFTTHGQRHILRKFTFFPIFVDQTWKGWSSRSPQDILLGIWCIFIKMWYILSIKYVLDMGIKKIIEFTRNVCKLT